MSGGDLHKTGVLIIGPVAPPVGGMTVSLNNIITSKLKDEYDLYVLDVTGCKDRDKKAGLLRRACHQIRLIGELCRILIVKRPRIAHVQMAGSLYYYRRGLDILICKLFGAKIIFHLRSCRIIEFYNNSSALGKRVIRSIMGTCDKIIALSSYWHDYLSTLTDPKKISIVPNGVKLSEFRMKEDRRDELGFSKDQTIVIFMGPIGKRKGAFDLLDAVPSVLVNAPNTRFVFCGEGEFDGELETFKEDINAKNLFSHVKCAGSVTGQEKYDYYLSSDIFVLPSYAENLPNSLLEAMASGLPVVVSDVGGIPELVKDGFNGFLVKAGDVNAIAKNVTDLAKDGNLRKSMGKINLTLVKEKYDMPIIADKIGDIYMSCR